MKAKEVGMTDFERNYTGIRQCINRREGQEAKQILAVVVTQRAKYLNEIGKQHE